MTPIKPNSKSTLVLSASFNPIGFFTARSTIRNIIVGGVRGVDSAGNIYGWEDWIKRHDFTEDQPCLRTSRAEFPVPTIVVIPGYFGNYSDAKKKHTRTSSLRQIFNLYGGICVYCKKEVKYSLATKDHVIPKSKGGSNYDANIVLSCKRCNNKKGSKFPFFDIEGSEVKPKILKDAEFSLLADRIDMRTEWEMFLTK